MEVLTKANFNNTKVKKTRRRISKACLSCRSRKIKCDSARPRCSSCVAKRMAECVYEDSPFTTNIVHDELSRLRQENERLRRALIGQKRDSPILPQLIKVYGLTAAELNEPLDMSHFTCVLHKMSRSIYYGPTSFRMAIEQHRPLYILYFQKHREVLERGKKAQTETQKTYISLLSIPDGTIYPEAFLENLLSFLPSHETISSILQEFFKSSWYQMFPIIEQDIFWQDFKRIFVEQEDGSQKLCLKFKPSEWARIALVLVVMKLVLLFQYGGVETIHPDIFVDTNNLLIKYVERLLECSRCLTRTSFPTLQTIFILRAIKKFDTTDGDGGDSSNGSIYFGLVIEMAKTLGIDRDVDILYKNETVDFRKTLRNIWKCCFYFDTMNAYDLGMVPHISDQFFDLQHINDGSLLFKTSVAHMNVVKSLNNPQITLRSIFTLLHEIEKFREKAFAPIYSSIRKIHNSSSPDVALIEEIILHIQTISYISTLHFMILRAIQVKEVREKHYVMCVKAGLLAAFALTDTLVAVSKFNSPLITLYSKNQYTKLVVALGWQPFTRAMLQLMPFAVLEVAKPKKGMYLPFEDSLLPAALRECSSICMSEWQQLKYNENLDPYICRDLESVNKLCLDLFHMIFLVVKQEKNNIERMSDRSFLFKYSFLRYLDGSFKHNEELKRKASMFKTDIKINFDVFPERQTIPITLERDILRELGDILELGPSVLLYKEGITNDYVTPESNPDEFMNLFNDIDFEFTFNTWF